MRRDLKEYVIIRLLGEERYLRREADGAHAVVSSFHTIEAAADAIEEMKRDHIGERYHWVERDQFFGLV